MYICLFDSETTGHTRAGIAQCLRAGWSGVRVPGGAGNFCFHHRCVQTDCGVHPAYLLRTRGSFPGGKTAVAWSWSLTSI